MTNEEMKKLKRKEFVKRLCDSNFSFEEIFLSNRGQKCRSCGLLRINKKLSPYSFSDLHQNLICFEHTKKKQPLNNNQDESFIFKNNIIGPNMNQNPININGHVNIEILEERPNIHIPIDNPEQILLDEPDETKISANNRNDNGINNYIEEEESKNIENKYVTLDKFNNAMSENNNRFQNVEGRLQNVEGRFKMWKEGFKMLKMA